MQNILSNTPSVSNPVFTVTVKNISDQMPMCHEDVPMMSIDDLVISEPQAEPVSTSAMDIVFQNITHLLDTIILQLAPWEVQP
jgi:hypothetical protein